MDLLDQFAKFLGYLLMIFGGIAMLAGAVWFFANSVLEAGRATLLARDFWDYRKAKGRGAP